MAETAEAKRIRRQPAGHQRRQKRRCSGHGHNFNMVPHRQRNQPVSGVAHPRHARIAHHRDVVALLQVHDQLSRAGQFVVLVVADHRLLDTVVVKQLHAMTRVLAGDEVHFFQHPQRPQRNVFHVPDGGAHQVERPCAGRAPVTHDAYRNFLVCFRHRREVYTRFVVARVTRESLRIDLGTKNPGLRRGLGRVCIAACQQHASITQQCLAHRVTCLVRFAVDQSELARAS